MNKRNLLKLAHYLETVVEAQEMAFDMSDYREDESGPNEPHTCGTAACALGYAPHVIPPLPGERYWVSYGNRAFEMDNSEWDWCFNSDWAGPDNTAAGAAKRIRHLCERGLPENWEEQMLGKAPYIFAEAS